MGDWIVFPVMAIVIALLWLHSKTEHGRRMDERWRQWEIEDEVARHKARMKELER